MKVFFFVYSSSHGSGGHYHSLDQISKGLGNLLEIFVISIGPVESPVISANEHFHSHLKIVNFLDLCKVSFLFHKIVKEHQPDVFHFFDTASLNLILLTFPQIKPAVFFTKCGGVSPIKLKWQFASEIIVFSRENYNWYLSNRFYKRCKIHLIPNRVLNSDFEVINSEFNKRDDTIYFLRISRLGGAYEKTLYDTFNLLNALASKYKTHIYIIGKIENSIRFNKIVKFVEENNISATFITDYRASNGRYFLSLADFVVGTGRSFMEAISLGIPCLAPTANFNMPVLIDRSNFSNFATTNFSERSICDDIDISCNLSRIQSVISNRKEYLSLSRRLVTLFNENYLFSNSVAHKYIDIYGKSILNNKRYQFSNHFNLYRKNIKYLFKTLAFLFLFKRF